VSCFMLLRLPRTTLFPYPTLFRSSHAAGVNAGCPHIPAHRICQRGTSTGGAMKILMTTDTIGGVWNYAMELSDALMRHGVEVTRSEEHTSELQSRENLVCRLLLEK